LSDIFKRYGFGDPEDLSIIDPRLIMEKKDILKFFSEQFTINPFSWEDIEEINKYLHIEDMQEIKYMQYDMCHYSEELKEMPEDSGGIYFFYIKNPIIPDMINYLVYIGRAKYTQDQNLKKRCREYFYDYKNVKDNDSDRVQTVRSMIKKWGNYLYLKYIKLNDNNIIDSLESLLINNIRPPFNSQIPTKTYHSPQPAEF
jgi:hypothetical protein